MLEFFRRLFRKRLPAADLSPWPHPLREVDIRLLLFHAVRVAGVTIPAKDGDMVDLLSPNPLEIRARPSRIEPLMTADDLESFGLNRRMKMSAPFFLCLHRDAQKSPKAAEAKLIRHAIAAIANRRDLNRLVHVFSPKHVVVFQRDDGSACPQSQTFEGKTWAGVAPDLPLPGCNADMCLCVHRPVIEL